MRPDKWRRTLKISFKCKSLVNLPKNEKVELLQNKYNTYKVFGGIERQHVAIFAGQVRRSMTLQSMQLCRILDIHLIVSSFLMSVVIIVVDYRGRLQRWITKGGWIIGVVDYKIGPPIGNHESSFLWTRCGH